MARTIRDIYDEMIAEKESAAMLSDLQPSISSYQTLLNDLTSASKVAVWRLLFFVVAVSIWTLESLFDEHKKWIENRAKEIITGNVYWYRQKALEFQFGEAVEFNGKEFAYPSINESAKIIAYASVIERPDGVLIKVAKDNNGSPAPLDSVTVNGEFDAFKAYMHKIKFAGVTVLPVTRPADLMKLTYRVFIDPMVINTSGELLSNPSVKPVEDAINSHLTSLPFNGLFTVNGLTDSIQEVSGVVNPVNILCEVKDGINPYTPVGDFYTPAAGYIKIDPAFPLSASIQYLIEP